MSVKIKWISHASFRIASSQCVVYIDPWKLAAQGGDADIVIVSHDHYDHCSPDDVATVCKPDTVVVASADTATKFTSARTIKPGEEITVAGVTIQAVPAYNVDKKFHPRSNDWIGVVITLDGKRIYYAGDTDLIDEMSDLADIDLALLPIGGTYTMDATEAARACEQIGCKMAIGYHWGDIVGTLTDAENFIKNVSCCETKLLQNGQSITL